MKRYKMQDLSVCVCERGERQSGSGQASRRENEERESKTASGGNKTWLYDDFNSLAMLKYVKLSENKSRRGEGRISADTDTTSFCWIISNTRVKMLLLYTLKTYIYLFDQSLLHFQSRKAVPIQSCELHLNFNCKLLFGDDKISKVRLMFLFDEECWSAKVPKWITVSTLHSVLSY